MTVFRKTICQDFLVNRFVIISHSLHAELAARMGATRVAVQLGSLINRCHTLLNTMTQKADLAVGNYL